jgi:hypothetical protein
MSEDMKTEMEANKEEKVDIRKFQLSLYRSSKCSHIDLALDSLQTNLYPVPQVR